MREKESERERERRREGERGGRVMGTVLYVHSLPLSVYPAGRT